MRKIKTPDAPRPIGPYSQAVAANGFLFCSGQIALDPKREDMVGVTAAEQTERACENIKAILAAANLSFDDVVKTTCYLTEPKDFSDFNAVYAKYFTCDPARSTVFVKALPRGALVEIEVTAQTRIV